MEFEDKCLDDMDRLFQRGGAVRIGAIPHVPSLEPGLFATPKHPGQMEGNFGLW